MTYRVLTFELDPDQHELRGCGGVLAVSPKALDGDSGATSPVKTYPGRRFR